MIHKLKEKIKAKAECLGFDFISFALPNRPPHFQEYLDWLAGGYQGGMAYLTRNSAIAARGNPGMLLPRAKSLIVLGLAYAPLFHNLHEQDVLSGRIASYALYPDYHRVLKRQIQLLAADIDRLSQRQNGFRIFIDSSSLLEKDSAFMAGAGYIGRNSLLLVPGYGSTLFLGCLLTDLEIPADDPFKTDLCGNCRRCLDACPAACITDHRTLQADRCIAYLTIEHKGIIPRELRAPISSRIFGCDDCQAVCPHNQIRHQTQEIMSVPVISATVDLATEVRLTPEEFTAKYASTPVLRAAYESFRRNLIVAMGNSKNYACLPVLEEILLKDPAWLLRLHAAGALAAIDPYAAKPILKMALLQESDLHVRDEILSIFAELQLSA